MMPPCPHGRITSLQVDPASAEELLTQLAGQGGHLNLGPWFIGLREPFRRGAWFWSWGLESNWLHASVGKIHVSVGAMHGASRAVAHELIRGELMTGLSLERLAAMYPSFVTPIDRHRFGLLCAAQKLTDEGACQAAMRLIDSWPGTPTDLITTALVIAGVPCNAG